MYMNFFVFAYGTDQSNNVQASPDTFVPRLVRIAVEAFDKQKNHYFVAKSSCSISKHSKNVAGRLKCEVTQQSFQAIFGVQLRHFAEQEYIKD